MIMLTFHSEPAQLLLRKSHKSESLQCQGQRKPMTAEMEHGTDIQLPLSSFCYWGISASGKTSRLESNEFVAQCIHSYHLSPWLEGMNTIIKKNQTSLTGKRQSTNAEVLLKSHVLGQCLGTFINIPAWGSLDGLF